MLAQEIEKEKAEKEKAALVTENKDERGASPMIGPSISAASQVGDAKGDGPVGAGDEAAGASEAESKPTTDIKDTEVEVKMES